jgi:hypothetical protein
MALTCGARPSASGREGEIGGSAGGSLGQARLGWRPVAVRLKKKGEGRRVGGPRERNRPKWAERK